ncbi:hypothetical protein [Pseudomonas sp. HS6]|uniref:hypothetical protein n=1 Tax=Pseudomonas sp. HS6 TaxID=2850559 RepID=UPI0020189182|nr:hypothetical protein [Pseudomonas sp. HS6]UQS13596.1 hypothetical protein JJN09_20545 [Pseudomonas sp. HS6]
MDSKVEFDKARKNIINVQENTDQSLAPFTGGASLIVAINGDEHPFETEQVTTDWSGGADHVVVKGQGREEVLLLFHSKLADGFYRFNDLGDMHISYIDESGELQQSIWYGAAYVAVSDGGKTKYGALDVRFIPLYGESKVSVRGGFFCHLNV